MELNERDLEDKEKVWCNDVEEPPLSPDKGREFVN